MTATLFDGTGNRITTGGAAVTMSSTAGALSAVTDNGDGTYTATLTSATTLGTATISFDVNGVAATSTAMVAFTIGAAHRSASTIAATPATIEADGTDPSTITVRLNDAAGRPHTTGGANVAITSTLGTLSQVSDHGDGRYTATLTATAVGTAVVGFAVNGATSPHSTAVSVEDTDRAPRRRSSLHRPTVLRYEPARRSRARANHRRRSRSPTGTASSCARPQ